MLLLDVVLMVGVAVVTAVVGSPIAAYLARPKEWGAHRVWAPEAPRTEVGSSGAFSPLDLGPDMMRWPSEIERVETGMAELPWPSETWDDPQFGRHQRIHHDSDDAFEARLEDRRLAQAEQRAMEQEARIQRNATETERRTPQPEARRTPPQTQRTGDDQARDQADARQQQQQQVLRRRREAQRRREQGKPAKPRSQVEAAVPTRDELEALVAKVGLAGTVQEIMSRTGWDFRRAAHFLAKARQGS